ncbi:hypothetical protein FHL15_000417 [Xylaria flabelliformis]|uniref:Uncharacterized protein n=1 Tax=Xylaria flabelliformis TaxID=2512241 RepID=A0A553IFV2_9PEZI|nr:hypothetical protein FHL15_000417 [Xylaria flabelliformis]
MLDAIPHVDGPKLPPFRGSIENVEFLKVLSSDQSDLSTGDSTGDIPHSRVFQFSFFSIDDLRPWVPGGEDMMPDDLVRYQMDPFYSECRALGLLVEKKKDDTLAVRCHGYAFLSEAIENKIREIFGFDDWNRQPEDEGTPLRAIIKDYIRFNTVCGRKRLSTMRSNLEQLNKMGIFNMDIREDNYRGGRLFDFSIALTPPHLWLWSRLRSRQQIFKDCRADLVAFDWMAKRLEEPLSSTQAKTRIEWLKRLRQRR